MKRHHACLPMVAFTMLVGGCTIPQQERKYRIFFAETGQTLVPGYRLPGESRYGPLWALVEGPGWQTRDGSGRTKAEFWTSGEFNGDATIDYAYILEEAATDTRTLVAFVSTAGGYEVEHLAEGFPWGIWLRTQDPGRYATAGAGGAGADSPGNVLEFETENQAIDFFQPEGGASSFVWNAATRSFDRFRTSD